MGVAFDSVLCFVGFGITGACWFTLLLCCLLPVICCFAFIAVCCGYCVFVLCVGVRIVLAVGFAVWLATCVLGVAYSIVKVRLLTAVCLRVGCWFALICLFIVVCRFALY